MSRWFRFYSGVVSDPKVQMLPPELFKHWVNALCIAAQHDGELPALAVVAFMLGHLSEAKTAEVLAKLCAAGLLDRTEKSFRPHNWDERQYRHVKTDNTNAQRQERYRNRKKQGSNADSNASNGVTPRYPEYTDGTDCSESNSEPNGSDAGTASSPRNRLFDEGAKKLKAMTGKTPDSCKTFIGQCLKVTKDDASKVLGLIEDAERNQVADAPGWIFARLNGGSSAPRSADKIPIEEAVEMFARTGHWSRHAPLADVSQAPPDILAKHGLGPDGRRIQ